jgi:hypothetical protein
MAENLDLNDPNISRVALKIFFRISEAWGLKPEEEKTLLGNPSSATLAMWRDGTGPKAPTETIMQISYVLGIYRSLRSLFPTENRANAWPQKPNCAFGGKSALNVMLSGGVADVRRYLAANE